MTMSSRAAVCFALSIGLAAQALLSCSSDRAERTAATERRPGRPEARAATADDHYSEHLGARLVVPEGVFPPAEADALVLPFMKEHASLFPGKRVLDIGSGSGVIALYAARLGAATVVATDIDPAAIEAIDENALRLGLGRVVSARLVPAEDVSAYSVIEPHETFDVILSNPPYSLDLDAARNTALIDTGDLGFSILRGLSSRLASDGTAILLYNSLFYHRLMVKVARHLGLDVRHHDAYGMTSWELEALFNASLRRVLERERLEPNAFEFDDDELPMLKSLGTERNPEPLLGETGGLYSGLIVIRGGSVLAGTASRSDGGAQRHAGAEP